MRGMDVNELLIDNLHIVLYENSQEKPLYLEDIIEHLLKMGYPKKNIKPAKIVDILKGLCKNGYAECAQADDETSYRISVKGKMAHERLERLSKLYSETHTRLTRLGREYDQLLDERIKGIEMDYF